MLLSKVLEKFVEGNPVRDMIRGALEHAPPESFVHHVCEESA